MVAAFRKMRLYAARRVAELFRHLERSLLFLPFVASFERRPKKTWLPIDKARSIHTALDRFQIELPSWGFANTGTRFGKFQQAAAASTIAEKFSDAGEVHRWTGVCPSVALHVLWDLPHGVGDVEEVRALAAAHGLRAGAINPNVFQDQIYKYGSLGNPDAATRAGGARPPARQRRNRQDAWTAATSRCGSPTARNYPGTQNIRQRKHWFEEGLQATHARLDAEPAHAGGIQALRAGLLSHRYRAIGAWRSSSRSAAGPQAKVLVDTGHHYQAQNIEQIVAWLLDLRTCSAASTSTTAAMPTTI